MSDSWTGEIQYKCNNDCRQMGCPGHTMRLKDSGSSDVISVYIDDKAEYFFDANQLEAITTLYKEGWPKDEYSSKKA